MCDIVLSTYFCTHVSVRTEPIILMTLQDGYRILKSVVLTFSYQGAL